MRKHHPYPRGSLGAQLRENSVVVMRRRSGVEQTSNLFTFFKPVSSPSTSSATQSTKKSGVHSKSKDISDECITMATDEATPTPSGRKRPHTSDSDSDGDIGIRKVLTTIILKKNNFLLIFSHRHLLVVQREWLP